MPAPPPATRRPLVCNRQRITSAGGLRIKRPAVAGGTALATIVRSGCPARLSFLQMLNALRS
eukprot:10864715-Alexandrium_andersonii.AAC.1